ncbi:MAG: hypothetical protein U0176_22040 [Bacteroidia bacterium]
MANVTFYDKNDYDGNSDAFTGAQRRSYSTSKAWDSIDVGSNTWLVVYNGSDFTGDYLFVSGDKHDLNHVSRSSGGDWKNQIKSFIMYSSQPSWWNSGVPQADDLNLAANQAMFTSSTNYMDDCSVYDAYASESNLYGTTYATDHGRPMIDTIQSIATGSSCWVEVWAEYNDYPPYLRIYPNSKLPDLNAVARYPSGDWKNRISGMKVYDTLPDATWNLKFDDKKFFSLFPDAAPSSDSSGPFYRYTTQDCTYDIRVTTVYSPKRDQFQVSFRIDYETSGHNDKVELDVIVDGNNVFQSVAYTYEQGGAVQIPKSVINAVDYGADIAGMLGLIETAGISEEAADSFIEAFDTACDVFNKVMNVLYKLSQANDGRFYLVAVTSHVICRALNSITRI